MKTATSKIKQRLLVILLGLLGLVIAFGISRYHRLHAYDDLIQKIAAEQAIDYKLIKAVIWRESRFRKNCLGKHGEIGLMQVTIQAADDWAQATGIAKISKRQLFNPETNIQAGAWYLKRSMAYWAAKPNPLPYALAEYNAGRSNVVRWAAGDANDANKFWDGITYPSTKRYVRDVLTCYQRYR